MVHLLCAVSADRQVIRRVKFPILGLSNSFYIRLTSPCKADHISDHLYIIQSIKITNPLGIWIPNFPVQDSCLIL